jgi:hypothetical protein
VEEASVVVDLVVAVTLVVAVHLVAAVTSAASKQVGSTVADKSQVELVPAEAALALAVRASEAVLRTLRARDPASLRLGIHRTDGLRPVALVVKSRVRRSQRRRISGSREISASLAFAITSSRGMRQIGTATGTGGMPILTTIGSLSLSTASGVD